MSPFHFTIDLGDKAGCTGIGTKYPKRMESKTDARLEFLRKDLDHVGKAPHLMQEILTIVIM
jgi:hypothetical protein